MCGSLLDPKTISISTAAPGWYGVITKRDTDGTITYETHPIAVWTLGEDGITRGAMIGDGVNLWGWRDDTNERALHDKDSVPVLVVGYFCGTAEYRVAAERLWIQFDEKRAALATAAE
jgi:hypothetical protein